MANNRPQPEPPLDATERLIAGLPVRRPGAALDQRVARALAGGGAGGESYPLPWVGRWRGAWAAAAVLVIGGAVGIAALVLLDGAGPVDQPGAGGAVVAQDPDHAEVIEVADALPTLEQVWVASEPTGRVVLTGGGAMEAVRVTAVRHTSFEEDGVTYDVAIPVEQMIYVPASYE